MSKKFRYKNGYEGVVSDSVADILEKKGEGKIVSDSVADILEKKGEGKIVADASAEPAMSLSKKERGEMIAKAVKLGLGAGADIAKLTDEALSALLKDKA